MSMLTFWGKLRRDRTLATSEGTIRNVLFEDGIPNNMYAFFLVEKRGGKYIIQKVKQRK